MFGQIENFETLLRSWNVQGRSVRPDHRMVAHSGFITVARKTDGRFWEKTPQVSAVGVAGEDVEDEAEGRSADPSSESVDQEGGNSIR